MSSLQAGHLGDLGAALVDDQLSPETRDLALAHLANCPECEREVEQQRRLKARLRSLAEPSLPFSLAMRLDALNPAHAPAPTHSGPPGSGLAGGAMAMAFPMRDRSRALAARRGRLMVGAATLVLFGIGTAAAAASDVQPATPAGNTAKVLTTSRTQAVTTSVPLHDPAFDAMNAAFVP